MVFLRADVLVLTSPFSRSALSCCSEGTSESEGTWISVYDGSSDSVDILDEEEETEEEAEEEVHDEAKDEDRRGWPRRPRQ